MIIRRLLFAAAVLLGSGSYTCCADGGSDTGVDATAANLIEWLRAEGAYINEKLVVRHVVADDLSSPRGVFATQDMDEGDVLCSIPSKIVVKSREDLMEGLEPGFIHCATIKAVMEAMSGGGTTPYGKLLLEQPKGYLPMSWSKAGIRLFQEILKTDRTQHLTEYDELPPHGVGEIGELAEECGADLTDPFYTQAAMLVIARADYEYMIPFYDMFNHHNGKYNIKHMVDLYKETSKENVDAVGFATTKPIKAGDQLYNSYNQCNICYEHTDWMGTPEMFLHYGFVETYPQRWLFDFARIKFDLDWKDGNETTGEVAVNFLVPPSEKGLSLLRVELVRLESLAVTGRSERFTDDYSAMSDYESYAIWQYFDALRDALSFAVGSNATLSEEVWDMGNDWWVKVGSLKSADENEHWVMPTHEASHEEL